MSSEYVNEPKNLLARVAGLYFESPSIRSKCHRALTAGRRCNEPAASALAARAPSITQHHCFDLKTQTIRISFAKHVKRLLQSAADRVCEPTVCGKENTQKQKSQRDHCDRNEITLQQ